MFLHACRRGEGAWGAVKIGTGEIFIKCSKDYNTIIIRKS